MTQNQQAPQDLLRAVAETVRTVPWDDESRRYQCVTRAEMLLKGIFGEGSRYDELLRNVNWWDEDESTERQRAIWFEGNSKAASILETAAEELDLFGATATGEQIPTGGATPTGRRVFVVHGHDDGLKETVARVLTSLDLEPIILHEQPNKGRTIIEKFEDYSEASFAVVLLTPDDMAYQSGTNPSEARPCARQNVILELGFFLGRLSRSRVVALHTMTPNFERPSDYDGVLFLPVDDSGNWRTKLVGELKAAGIDVDANKLFKK